MMPVRNYLTALVLVCTLGGLMLGAYLIERQQSLDEHSQAAAELQRNQHDAQRLEDHIKQLLLSIDLLFGAGETYMLRAAQSQVQRTQRLSGTVALDLHQSNSRERGLQQNVDTLLDGLSAEIELLATQSAGSSFGVSDDQLNRVDRLSEELVDTIEALSQHMAQGVQFQRDQNATRRTQFDGNVWIAVLSYLLSVIGALWWASRSVSQPLASLSQSARAALHNDQPLTASQRGPSEVLELTTHIGEFVDSLQLTIAQNGALIEAIPDTLFVVHRTEGITRVKPGIDTPVALRDLILDWDNLRTQLGKTQTKNILTSIEACLDSQRQQQFDLAVGNGEDERFYEARATAIGKDQAVLIIRDLTTKRQAESRIRHLAFRDGLTGLLNRRAFMASLIDHFASAPTEPFALLYVDVDRFKIINDTRGHDVGDAVLKHVTECLSRCLRANDQFGNRFESGEGYSARVGGDEFVVLLPRVSDVHGAEKVARRLSDAMASPFNQADMQLSVTVSIGVALYPEHGETDQDLMNHADLAMFQAKRAGGGAVCVYDHELGSRNQRKLSMEAKLREALRNEELFLNYQPKIDLKTGRITGAEALVRWQDGPTVIPPDEFIPIAEESGLIIPLGDFVMATAIRQTAQWRRQGLDMESIAINVSAAQLKQSEFLESIRAVAEKETLDPSMINLEITESLLIGNYDIAVELLQTLRKGGFSIALDDFGTGYSSLSHIKDLPLDCLKIDRSFVRGITDSDKEQAIIGTIIQLGQTLGLKIVAEGVETQAQAHFLQQCQCDEAQGYLYSPPLPASGFEALLMQQSSERIRDTA